MHKILIVEDDERIMELLRTSFAELENFCVLHALDGQEALGIARADAPEVIIMDIRIPKIDGISVCKSVKSDPSISKAKVLILSGLTQDSDIQRAREAGADDFITKPFNPTALVERVEALLRA